MNIKKIILICVFLMPLHSYAAWNYVSTSADGEISVYFDPDTVRNFNGFKRVWVIGDFKVRNKFGSSSWKSYREFDCTQLRTRTLSFSSYQGNMGAGPLNNSDNEISSWAFIHPESMDEALAKSVCSRR